MGKRAGAHHGWRVRAVRRLLTADRCGPGGRAAHERQYDEWHVVALRRCQWHAVVASEYALPGAGDRRSRHAPHRGGRRVLDVSRSLVRCRHPRHDQPARCAAADHRRNHERWCHLRSAHRGCCPTAQPPGAGGRPDRKSTRLNSSHVEISYAVFCLKKKKTYQNELYKKNKKKKTISQVLLQIIQ